MDTGGPPRAVWERKLCISWKQLHSYGINDHEFAWSVVEDPYLFFNCVVSHTSRLYLGDNNIGIYKWEASLQFHQLNSDEAFIVQPLGSRAQQNLTWSSYYVCSANITRWFLDEVKQAILIKQLVLWKCIHMSMTSENTGMRIPIAVCSCRIEPFVTFFCSTSSATNEKRRVQQLTFITWVSILFACKHRSTSLRNPAWRCTPKDRRVVRTSKHAIFKIYRAPIKPPEYNL